MIIYLIKDESVNSELFTDVIEILSSIVGPIEFKYDNNLLIDFNDTEYLKNEFLKKQDFEVKDTNLNYPDMSDAILSAQKLLGSGLDIYQRTEEIDLKCPYCDENVFMVSLPLGSFPRGFCKNDLRKKSILRSKFSIKEYIEKTNAFTWDTFIEKINKITESKEYINQNKVIELEQLDKIKVTNWDSIFKKCNDYRINKNLNNDDFVILLTEVNNTKNWFSGLDDKFPSNAFIHTKDWQYFINCNAIFPIAYEVIALIIQKFLNNSFNDLNNFHRPSIGCINDLCIEKREIILKLRTADICPECMKILKEKLSFSVIKHALTIIESLRKKMLFSQNFLQLSPLSKIIVDNNMNIYLPDFENIKIKLNPLEKTLYMLYLLHPEGIEISSICNFKNEMYNIYSHISNRGDIQEMKSKIDRMADVTSNSASEKISKIKEKFVTAIGSELAQNYYIKGANAEAKKISIDRNLVEIQD